MRWWKENRRRRGQEELLSGPKVKKPGVRGALIVLFWSAVLLLSLSFVFTIIGSAVNQDVLLDAGIIGWLATTCLLFTWLVIWMLTRTRRYRA